MDWPEKLFVRSYDELESALRARDDYERLKIAATLRRLLLDASPLIHQANKTHRLKIRFRINRVGNISDLPFQPDLRFHAHGLDPHRFQIRDGTVDLKVDQFLSQPLIELPESIVTIGDVIKFGANKAGGVHLDASRDEHEAIIETALGKLSSSGFEPLAIALETIATITLAALTPLRDAIAQPPSALPLIAWYKSKRTGSIHFAGQGQYLKTDFKEAVNADVSWNAVVRILPQAEPGTRTIYEIGNLNGQFPRLSVTFDSKGNLKATAQLDDHRVLIANAPNYHKSPFFDRRTYVGVDLCYLDGSTRLSLYVNARRIATNAVDGKIEARVMSRHTIGAALDGAQSVAFDMSEMIIASRCPNERERSDIAEYLWLQWHG